MSSATKPSATGPTPPSEKPPGLIGVLQAARHVRDDVGHLLVGQVAREAGHVGRAGADGLDDLLGRDVPVLQRRGVRAVGQRVTGAR